MEDFHGLRRKGKEIRDVTDKRHALAVMIQQLESDPNKVMAAQVNDASVAKVHIGRIDLDLLSGKRSGKVVESL